jgi:hypothetical protein
MNFIDNEYLIPIFIGDSAANRKGASRIMKKTGIRAHFFAPRFLPFDGFRYSCHKVFPFRDELISDRIVSFVNSVEEYYCPIILMCDDFARQAVKRNSIPLESACVAMDIEEFFSESMKGSGLSV